MSESRIAHFGSMTLTDSAVVRTNSIVTERNLQIILGHNSGGGGWHLISHWQ